MKQFHEGLVIIKRDAIEDGVSSDVINFIDQNPAVRVQACSSVSLSTPEILDMYEPELLQDPSERREILMVMGAQAMTGTNLLLGVRVEGVGTQEEGFTYLNTFKGSIRDTSEDKTIRGTFPFPRPEGFDGYSFWFRAPFFVRNRVHVPDSHDAVAAVEQVAQKHGVSLEELYGRK